MRKQTPKDGQMLVDLFNESYSVGQEVQYWAGVKDDGPGVVSNTTTPAQMLGGHTAVVWVVGRRDCVALTHVVPLK